ncbi:hypothetical protein [Flavobacterium pectinovorum]|uniref:hypothetical protein n=1 Tax=Flavobacterium pectinovorum TaxID=29533 RepID=UPI001FAD98D4|nr:hypothetical protein [Flavobacterium pectinovorum]MCI9844758.1 hypothetical protein [Flavobacterium pectinovorum]
MKTSKYFIVIVFSLFFVQTVSAQTKKKTTVTKQQVAKEKITFAEKILDNDIDAATLLIDNVFGVLGVTFTGVEDSKDYIYDENLKKTDTIFNHFRTLLTDAKFNVFLVADNRKKVTEFRIVGSSELDEVFTKKIIQTTGVSGWTIVEAKSKNALYKKGKYFSKVISEGYLDFEAFVPEKQKLEVSTASFIVHSSFKETISFAHQLLLKMGGNLLVTKRLSVYNDENYNFESYNQELIYSQGTKVTIREDASKKKSIFITNQSAVVFASLKSKLLDEKWQEKYTNTIHDCVYYRKDNLMVSLALSYKSIELYAVPDLNDTQTQLTYGEFLTLNQMNDIYDGFSYEDRIAYMKDHFALNGFYNIPTFIVKRNGYNIRYLFFDNKEFENNWGHKFSVETDHMDVNNYYTAGIDNLSLLSENSKTKFENNIMSNRTQFYDKAIYNANKAGKVAKENAELLAKQRQEAEQKQLEIQREQEKIKRNAELTDVINKTTDQLLNMFKKD